jgi:hypothetical protein
MTPRGPEAAPVEQLRMARKDVESGGKTIQSSWEISEAEQEQIAGYETRRCHSQFHHWLV